MNLGAISVSLAVADLGRSLAFYESLGFEVIGGDADEHWLILRSGTTTIGLFEGMFEGNILTFNPHLGPDLEPTDAFTEVRVIRDRLVAAGIEVTAMAEGESGPGHLMLTDPDGNAILIDQA